MNRTAGRLVRLLSVALVLVLAQACGDGGPGEGTTAQAPRKPMTAKAPPQPVQAPARDTAPSGQSRRQAADDVPSEQVRATVRTSVQSSGRSIKLPDPHTGRPLELAFDFIHSGVSSTTGGRYLVCSNFHTPGGTPYDVDYYVGRKGGKYGVEDVVIHKADRKVVLSNDERDRLDSAR